MTQFRVIRADRSSVLVQVGEIVAYVASDAAAAKRTWDTNVEHVTVTRAQQHVGAVFTIPYEDLRVVT